MYLGLPTALNFILSSFLWDKPAQHRPADNVLTFHLRHEHTVTNTSRNIFSNIPSDFVAASEALSIKTRPMKIYKPSSIPSFHASRRNRQQSLRVDWEEDMVPGPNYDSRETLLRLAKMTYNAYTTPEKSDWYPLGDNFPVNNTQPFGWEPEDDGFRGYIYVSSDNSTVIMSIKGTSASWLVGGGGPTVAKDKLNDNLLFSCCCARVGPTWSPVCGCYKGRSTCDQNCVEDALVDESLFYGVGINLYNNVTYMYPNAKIWVTGHSLGGALASLVGHTFGAPVVTFEAPGERMAARRLHLPPPPSTQHITHVFHTGDPIAMGTCNGVTSSCAIGGYALESRCHTGQKIVYDTVSLLGWSVDIRTHVIKAVIERVLSTDWWKGEDGREVPAPVQEDGDCTECYNWKFIEGDTNVTSRCSYT